MDRRIGRDREMSRKKEENAEMSAEVSKISWNRLDKGGSVRGGHRWMEKMVMNRMEHVEMYERNKGNLNIGEEIERNVERERERAEADLIRE